ncbi:MAG TPA: tetratricopeptide repeat protein [Telluria sp.]
MSQSNSPATASLLSEAVAFHQKGQLQAAQALYREVLSISPRQFDALHLLGVVARQLGQAELAVSLISDAIGVDATQAAPHCNLGAALQDLDRAQEALASYERAVQLDPNYALALSNRGNALRKLGRTEEALRSYDRALELRPAYPEASCNRAAVLQELGRPEEALASADQALAGRGNYAEALCVRGNALYSLARFPEAVECYERALMIKDDSVEAHLGRGIALQKLHAFEEALESYDRAIALRPDHASAQQYRANTLRSLGRNAEAIAGYRHALALGADAAQIAFALAALGAGDAPERPPQGYVKALFDQYAGHFDEHLSGVLDYQTPAVLGAALARTLAGEPGDTLDLGCGTGLCAPYLRPYSRSLTGVDLSNKMLDKARERGLYDRLECTDIAKFLAAGTDDFDLIVAADVFVYFGDLAPIFSLVHSALRPNGCFCFSVEASEGADFTLTPSNRFAHALPYLRRLAGSAGLAVVEAQSTPLRTENGAQVPGHAVVLRSLKPAAQ